MLIQRVSTRHQLPSRSVPSRLLCRRFLRVWAPAYGHEFQRFSNPRSATGRTIRRCSSAPSLEEVNKELRKEIDRYGEMEPHPVTLFQILDTLQPWRIAKFLHNEYPIRCAERILMIESISGWEHVPELVDAHGRHVRAFREMRQVKRKPTLDAFTKVVNGIVNGNRDIVALMAMAMQRLSTERAKEFDANFVDGFLNDFLLHRLGSNVLMSQYLACVDETRPQTGLVDPECDVVQICRQTAESILDLTEEHSGIRPYIHIEGHSTSGDGNNNFDDNPKFPSIPGAFTYIIQELLKNSCRATIELATSMVDPGDIKPVKVIVCADEHRMMIQISDRAGGIPFDVGQHVWSYLYTTANKDKRKATALAGFGVGLPLSRLYASYLGGSLDLVSLPGYGTHAYIYFPRLSNEQVEVVPDKDHHWHAGSHFVL